MSKKLVIALWHTLEEPRAVTAAMVAAYGLTLLVGIDLLLHLPGVSPVAACLRLMCGLLLVFAGCTGMPSAWRGAYWLERLSALAMAGGLAIWGFRLVTAQLFVHRDLLLHAPLASVCSIFLGVLFGFTRFRRVAHMPYAFGKGPLLPETQARLHVAAEQELGIIAAG
ncbi:hypothetical protein [Trueperella sp. LYQ143]|uniref:hypothetical protein n=1 Tax=unclassified Trueperella TaxID=2630174 RepID=UPI00398363B4